MSSKQCQRSLCSKTHFDITVAWHLTEIGYLQSYGPVLKKMLGGPNLQICYFFLFKNGQFPDSFLSENRRSSMTRGTGGSDSNWRSLVPETTTQNYFKIGGLLFGWKYFKTKILWEKVNLKFSFRQNFRTLELLRSDKFWILDLHQSSW